MEENVTIQEVFDTLLDEEQKKVVFEAVNKILLYTIIDQETSIPECKRS